MEMTPVRSSNIKAVSYDPIDEELLIAFHTGTLYQFLSVPEFIYEGLMNAVSKGTYFHEYIKDKYPTHRIR